MSGGRISGAPSGDGASGTALISFERARQVAAEGWTPEHDDEHEAGELAAAAVCYALHPYSDERLGDDHRVPAGAAVPAMWPWDTEWWKPTPKDRVRELVKAGALIAAEIDRLLRAESRCGTQQERDV